MAAVLLAVLVAAGAAAAGKPSSGIPVEVCQDTDPAAPECETQEIDQAEGGGGGGGSSPKPTDPAAESHEVDLATGDSTTDVGGGEEITLDLDSKDPKPVAPADGIPTGTDQDQAPDRPRPEEIGPPRPGGSNLGQVATTGGGGFGGSSAFDYVSSDQALSGFAVPPFLLPIYISAGHAYGVPWNVLASINKIETDFGRLGACAVSSAGARGWMQFMPATWDAYGVDASGDGVADPCNPVDAIYAAARYLNASGAGTDLRGAVFAYNHADWYVDEVLATAGVYGSLPSGLVAETGSLAFGHFPVAGPVLYGDDFRAAEHAGERPTGVRIFPRGDAHAVATQAVEVERILLSREAADAYAHRFGGSAAARPNPRPAAEPAGILALALAVARPVLAGVGIELDPPRARRAEDRSPRARDDDRRRLEAKPAKDRRLPPELGIAATGDLGVEVADAAGNRYRYEGLDGLAKGIEPGAELDGGERIGALRAGRDRPLLFSTRGAGGAAVDPRPLLDGYRLQEAANYYHAVEPLGRNPFLPDPSLAAGGGSVEGTQEELARKVLADSGIDIYECGRQDVERGIVDRRILGALLYLRKAGMTLTVTSLRCGHSYYTAGGSVSAHSFGAAVDIAAFNGQPVMGNQGPGSLTEQAIKLLMQLEGEAQPAQLISLMDFGGPSLPLSDHDDHLHVGYSFEPALGEGRSGEALDPVLFDGLDSRLAAPHDDEHGTKAEEQRLSERFGEIENPQVNRRPGAAGVHVEAESAREAKDAERLAHRESPLTSTPTAAGARIIDISVPAGVDGGRAWGLGTVDGRSHGWHDDQVVALAHRAGTWQVVGPPETDGGRIATPKLNAIAADTGGYGYAVGDGGAVVELRGERPPRMLDAPAGKDLIDVAVDEQGDGYAVGKGGTALALTGHDVAAEDAGDGRPDLSSVAVTADGPMAAGVGATGEGVLLQRTGSGWEPVPLGVRAAPGTGIRLSAVADRGGELWVGGALTDSQASGPSAELPFAARREADSWRTFCAAAPALANVRELGSPSERPCDGGLVAEPGEHGPVSDIVPTEEGIIVATGTGLRILAPTASSFRPLPAGSMEVAGFALEATGRGWLWAPDGRMNRIVPSDSRAPAFEPDATELPIEIDAAPSAVAVAPDGDRAMAFGGGATAAREAGEWRLGPATGLGILDAAWAAETAWAVDESGTLISAGEDAWETAGLDAIEQGARDELLESAGGEPLLPPDEAGEAGGFRAIAFGSEIEGFAVGADGLVARHLVDGWEVESAPTSASLLDVAAGVGGVIAVGEEGTLIERAGDGWSEDETVRELAGRESVTAAEALSDGTMLAAAGGAIIERARGGAWRAAPLPPLGMPVARLAAYRDADGGLRAVALVGEEEQILLSGSEEGWRPIPLPPRMTVSAFAPVPGSERLWAVGLQNGRAVTTEIDLAGASGAGGLRDDES